MEFQGKNAVVSFYHNSDLEGISEGTEEIGQKNLMILYLNTGRFRRKI